MNKRLNQTLSILRSNKHFHVKKVNAMLLLLPMGLGDAVLFLDTIDYYFKMPGQNRKIIIMTTISANKVFRFARPDLNYEFFGYDPVKMDMDSNYFMKCLKRLGSRKYDVIVYPLRGFLTMDLLFGKLKADIKVTLNTIKEGSKKNIKIWLRDQLIKNSTILQFQPWDMDLIRYARIAEIVCKKKIKAKLPKIEIDKVNVKAPYCLVSIGSSKIEKCWPSNRYGELANYVLSHTNSNIMFTGSKEDRKEVEHLVEALEPKERIINRCGETSIEELFEIVAGAQVLIGNDSGPIHIAAAVNTPAICIVGGWDYERVYPYKVEIAEENRPTPIIINTGYKNCYRCLMLYGKRGAMNSQCAEMIREGKPCLCIDDISSGLVIECLRRILREEEVSEAQCHI